MQRINSNEALMTWLMNRFNQKWGEKAILKGGMVLRLLDCPRATNDLDYVFVPFKTKKDILPLVQEVIKELEGAKSLASFHSTSLRIGIHYKNFQTQIEADVDKKCKIQSISTVSLAHKYNMLPEVISVVSLDWALAHKMAAWNERGLMRDLYDMYFIHHTLGVMPDLDILRKRLSQIHYSKKFQSSQQPKKMSLSDFCDKLDRIVGQLTFEAVKSELNGVMAPEILPGLDYKMKIVIKSLVDRVKDAVQGK